MLNMISINKYGKNMIDNEVSSTELENYGLDTPLSKLLVEWKTNNE